MPRIAPVLLVLCWASLAPAADPDPKGLEFFEAKVRPILVERCYGCHSAGAKKVRGNLLLDAKAGWEKGGDTGPAIVPGKPDESPLVRAVRYDDPALKMPPKGKLPDGEVAVLVDWVGRGAPDPRTGPAAAPAAKRVIDLDAGRRHWAFRRLARVEPPAVKDEAWVRNPIDRFVLAKLEAHGRQPAPTATRRALIRRASFDLVGLPPAPEEVEAFVHDPDPGAYDRLIDRLLESPHHGERWARHWLDLARFAESHGFEHDYDRPTAYHYRDFVIEALNRDLPYDTFVKWQIAGDELSPDDNLALKATGFLAAGVHSTQITANQVEKERYDELDDVVHTIGTAMLGLTVGCARCHDHKYDPIPTADYYRLVATFTTTVRSEVDLNSDPEGYRKAKETFDREHAPYLLALASYEADPLPSRLARWEATRTRASGPPQWTVLEVAKFESKGGASSKKQPDGSVKVEGKNPDFDTYVVTAPCDLPEITAVKVEALADPSLAQGGPGRAANGNFALTDLRLDVGPRYGIGSMSRAALVNPKATFEQAGLPIRAAIDDDPKSGWAVDPKFGKDHAAVFEVGSDLRPDGGATLVFTLRFENNAGHNLGRIRVSATGAPRPVGLDGDGIPAEVAPILARPRDERSPEQVRALLAWYRTIDPEWRARKRAIDDHAKAAPKPKGVKCLISSEGLPAVRLHTQGADFLPATHYLRRGDPNQKQGEAKPGFLQVLTDAPDADSRWKPEPPKGWRTSHRRAALARWIADTERGAGHLLARVIVNRLWYHHFGRGLVATPSDFGAQGEPPSHPELLDWLAGELVRGGWRLKPIHKLMMTSAAYRVEARTDEATGMAGGVDPLFGRRSRRRLEAEAIHDALLAVSGRLDPRMYGPGSLDERQPRRSIYFTVKRSQLVPMMTLFDAPDALTGVGVRPVTTVAPQSLLILNSPVVRDWASGFARRVAPRSDSELPASVRSAYLIALSRPPDADEAAEALAFVARQRTLYRSRGAGDGLEPALSDFCQVLMGLNEFVFIE